MIRNIKIGLRLSIAFSIINGFLLIMGMYTIWNFNKITDSIISFTDHEISDIEYVNSITTTIQALDKLVLDYSVNKKPEILNEINTLFNSVNENSNKVINNFNNDLNGEHVNNIKNAVSEYHKELNQIGFSNDISQKLDEEKLNNLNIARSNLIVSLSKLNNVEIQSLHKKSNETKQISSSQEIIIIALFATSVIVAIIMSIIITLSITRPIKQAIIIADKIANGELNI